MSEFLDKTKVIIFTNNFKITGNISNFQNTRLTDYISESRPFIAVTDVVIEDRSGGNNAFTAPFVNVHKNHIEVIFPVEQIQKNSV